MSISHNKKNTELGGDMFIFYDANSWFRVC